jgi:hypothetical protein
MYILQNQGRQNTYSFSALLQTLPLPHSQEIIFHFEFLVVVGYDSRVHEHILLTLGLQSYSSSFSRLRRASSASLGVSRPNDPVLTSPARS